jgi:hypothetical protein
MIFYWLTRFWRNLRRLFTPPQARDIARIDPDAPCPVCGARSGKLTCAWSGTGVDLALTEVLCTHTCDCCGARWFEKPVAKVTSKDVWPSEKKLESPSWSRRAA